jgi:hypothetical protein
MPKLIASIALAIAILLAVVQFGPSLVFGQEESHVKACYYHGYRSAEASRGSALTA